MNQLCAGCERVPNRRLLGPRTDPATEAAGKESRDDPKGEEATNQPCDGVRGDARRKTREQFQELTGYEAESISGLAQVDNGWSVEVDVVELRRVPDTASLLATYRVTTDATGDVVGYERVRRYNRGQAD